MSAQEKRLGDRVEILWKRGMADEWCVGTLLEGGRVQLDKPFDYVPDGQFVLEPEEIAESRPLSSNAPQTTS